MVSLALFLSMIEPIDVLSKKRQNRQTRDLLLPKLISGDGGVNILGDALIKRNISILRML